MLLADRYGWAMDLFKAAVNVIEPLLRQQSSSVVTTFEAGTGIARPTKFPARKFIR